MKIAVIGGVGSGKSTVLAMLKELGETVIDCDAVYRDVKKLPQFKKDMVAKYGDVLTDGEIDNKKVSAKVLCSKDAIDGLNALSHPYIKKELDKLTEGKSRVFVEVQVFEGGLLENYFDKVWLVIGDRQTRMNRVVIRDDCATERVEKIMALQPDDETRKKHGYVLIVNDGSLRELQEKVAKKLKELN